MRPSRRLLRVLAAGALALAATSCGSDDGETATTVVPVTTPSDTALTEVAPDPSPDTSTETVPDSGSATAPPATDEPAPPDPPSRLALEISSPLVGGGDIDLASAAGSDPVMLWFWAPS